MSRARLRASDMPPLPKKHALPTPPSGPGRSPYSNATPSTKTSRCESSSSHNTHSPAIRKNPSSSTSSAAAAAAARTGQACDRCKVRKIRCDNTIGGCIPCRQNSSECRTTDRITHRATARGHTETLERENSQLSRHIKNLEQQVIELGGSPKTPSYYGGTADTYGAEWTQASDSQGSNWPGSSVTSRANTNSYTDEGVDDKPRPNVFSLPTTLPDAGTDHYLGFTPTKDLLGQGKGTSLSLFGMHLDLADFIPDAAADTNNPRSYRMLFAIFKAGMHGKAGDMKVDLPPTHEECLHNIELYVSMCNGAIPAIHPPTIRDLISRIYFQGYQPSNAETVILHSMLAWIKYQFAARNEGEQTRNLATESNLHYHYALSLTHEIIGDRTFETVQALTLLCAHVRNFPMPEAAWMTGTWAINVAIDMGLHRSVGPWPPRASKDEILQIEMRKRIFWLLFTFMVALSGKLGRPMPVHVGDFDVELPEFVNENLERVDIGLAHQQCPFYGAVYLFKRAELLCETYSTIYAAEPAYPYEQTLERLEVKLRKLNDELPPLIDPSLLTASSKAKSMVGLFVHRAVAEVELVLHHPALCTSESSEVVNRNLSACTEAANRLIRTTVQLMTLNAIDSTWYSTTTFIAAIFTLLFAIEQRNRLDASDMTKLRSDMGVCLDVFANIGRMLGTGPRLRDNMAEIINKALERISRRQIQKTATVVNADLKDSHANSSASAQVQPHAQGQNEAHSQIQSRPFKQESTEYQPQQLPTNNQDSHAHQSAQHDSYLLSNAVSVSQHQTPAFVQYAPQSSVDPTLQYQFTQFDPQAAVYQSMADVSHAVLAPSDAFMYQPSVLGGSNAWHHWAQVAREEPSESDYNNTINPANALMALGGHGHANVSSGPNDALPTQTLGHSAAPSVPSLQARDMAGYALPSSLQQQQQHCNSDIPNLMTNAHLPSAMQLWHMNAWESHSRINPGG